MYSYPSSAHVQTTSVSPLLVFPSNLPRCAVPLMLSNLVTSNENRSILSSATSSPISCFLVSATVPKPHNIAGVTILSYEVFLSFLRVPSCHRSLLPLFSTHSTLPAPSFYTHSHSLPYFARLTPNTCTRPP